MSVIPITLLTGFLGAGKTTLLNRLLRGEHGLRIGVLVNDFGDVNIDAKLVADIERDAITLTNGCACCTMRGDLYTSVLRMLDRPTPPEHIVVEASGIADPVGIVTTFRRPALLERMRLDGVITLLDAERVRDPHLDRQLIEDQIVAADLVVLNKADLVESQQRDDLHLWIRSLVPNARVLDAVHANLPLDLVLSVGGTAIGDVEDTHRHAHPTYATWTYRSACPLSYRKTHEALSSLPAGILRAKGIAFLADAPAMRFAVQVVGRRASIDVLGLWHGEDRRTEIVFIGEPEAINEDELAQRMDACFTDAVPLLSQEGLARIPRTFSSPASRS